jgi:hypothetical protein
MIQTKLGAPERAQKKVIEGPASVFLSSDS